MRIVFAEEGFEYSTRSERKIKSPEDVSQAVPEMHNMDREVFTVIMLSARNNMIAADAVSVGILDASLVHPREVFRTAISKNAGGVILVHNHPTGDLTPSAEDIRVTKQLVEAGKIIDIKVLDHVILGNGKYLSLREEGLVSFA